MFDEDDPPLNFKEFSKQVKRTLETAEIDSEDDYDTAIFYVTHDGEGKIQYAYDIYEENEGNIDGDEILYLVFPYILRSSSAKFFALVLPAEKPTGEEVVMLLTGDINQTHLLQATIDREEDYLELEPWERLDVLDFGEISVPYRRSIVWQG